MPEMMMAAEKWDVFFELMDEVLNQSGTWMDKAARVKREAEARDAEGTLSEFTSWFQEGDE
jgi:hypothetical protein